MDKINDIIDFCLTSNIYNDLSIDAIKFMAKSYQIKDGESLKRIRTFINLLREIKKNQIEIQTRKLSIGVK